MSKVIKIRCYEPEIKGFHYYEIKVGEEVWIYSGHEDPQLFTGLFDKNGKEIYEGDIVQFGNFNLTEQVIFENGCFKFVDDDNNKSVFNKALVTICKVIGSIYENPELLENE